MGGFSGGVSFTILIASLAYIFYVKPRYEAERNEFVFCKQVLAFIDGLSFSGITAHCSIYDLRPFVEHQLSESRNRPGNQPRIEYTTSNGHRFTAYSGKNDHVLFAVICVALYAQDYSNRDLIAWCESELEHARKFGIHF